MEESSATPVASLSLSRDESTEPPNREELRRLAPFAVAALVGLAAVFLTWPPVHPEWIAAAAGGTVLVFAAAVWLPWRHYPRSTRLAPLLAYLCVVAALRHGEGGATSGFATLIMLPVIWVALYETRHQLVIVLAGSALVLAAPTVLAGPPEYPSSEWRRGLLLVGTATVVGYVVQHLVAKVHARVIEARQVAHLLRARERQLQALTLELQRSNRELQDFASVAAHDLQEPLRKIQAFGDRLGRRHADDLSEDGRDYLERMTAAAARMQALIADLLAFARVSTRAAEPRRIDLNDAVRDVLTDLERPIEETGAVLQIRDLPVIEADPMQMRQLFQNLLGNALKFRRSDAQPEIEVSARTLDGGQAEISVTDNGIGFDPQYADRIFAPFQRLHGRDEYAGTGMGLAICRRIVERHGGTIAVSSKPGAGTRFTIELPVRQASLEETA